MSVHICVVVMFVCGAQGQGGGRALARTRRCATADQAPRLCTSSLSVYVACSGMTQRVRLRWGRAGERQRGLTLFFVRVSPEVWLVVPRVQKLGAGGVPDETRGHRSRRCRGDCRPARPRRPCITAMPWPRAPFWFPPDPRCTPQHPPTQHRTSSRALQSAQPVPVASETTQTTQALPRVRGLSCTSRGTQHSPPPAKPFCPSSSCSKSALGQARARRAAGQGRGGGSLPDPSTG